MNAKRTAKGRGKHGKGSCSIGLSADGKIPLACVLKGDSVYASQSAPYLLKRVCERTTFLYAFADAAYDAKTIKDPFFRSCLRSIQRCSALLSAFSATLTATISAFGRDLFLKMAATVYSGVSDSFIVHRQSPFVSCIFTYIPRISSTTPIIGGGPVLPSSVVYA